MRVYRLGGHWKVTIVETGPGQDDRLVGMGRTVEDAQMICDALNEKEIRDESARRS